MQLLRTLERPPAPKRNGQWMRVRVQSKFAKKIAILAGMHFHPQNLPTKKDSGLEREREPEIE